MSVLFSHRVLLLWKNMWSFSAEVSVLNRDERVQRYNGRLTEEFTFSVKRSIHKLHFSCLETDWWVGVWGDKWRNCHRQLGRPIESTKLWDGGGVHRADRQWWMRWRKDRNIQRGEWWCYTGSELCKTAHAVGSHCVCFKPLKPRRSAQR